MTNTVPKYPLFSMRLLTVSDLDEFLPNPYNRPIVTSTLKDLDKVLENGTFQADEPIIVNYESGVILNGHHRIEAIKRHYALRKKIPNVFVFFTNTEPENIVYLNQIGKKWSTEDYIKYYASDKPKKPKNPNYTYLMQARDNILKSQKTLLIANKLTKSQIYVYLCGHVYNAMGRSGLTANDHIIDGGAIIKLDKKYILGILPYYKSCENDCNLNILLKTESFKVDISTFLLICYCHNLDLTVILAKVINNKRIFTQLQEKVVLKEHCFDVLFQAIPKKMLGCWCDFSAMKNDYQRKIAAGVLSPVVM